MYTPATETDFLEKSYNDDGLAGRDHDVTRINRGVGPDGPNRKRDSAKVENALGQTGYLDLNRTQGPTGYWFP